jgi:hypothetical protein
VSFTVVDAQGNTMVYPNKTAYARYTVIRAFHQLSDEVLPYAADALVTGIPQLLPPAERGGLPQSAQDALTRLEIACVDYLQQGKP